MIKNSIILVGLFLAANSLSFGQQSLSNYFNGLAAIENNQPAQAKAYLTNALQDGVKPSVIHTRLAEVFLISNDFNTALIEFKEAEKTDPNANQYNIARCYAFQDNPSDAINALKANIKSAQPVPYYMIQKEPAFQRIKSSPEWVQFWSQNQYSAAESNLNEAYYLFETNKLEDAVNLLNGIIEKRPKFAEAIFLRGLSYFQLKEFSFAGDDFHTASSLKPLNDNYLYLETLARTESNQYKKALKAIREAIRLNPYNPDYLYYQALILFKDDQLTEASSKIQYFASYFGYQERTKLLQAKILVELKQLDQAMGIINLLIQNKQGGDEAYFTRGLIFQLQNSFVQAIDDYGMALDINPKDPLSYLNRGNCYLQIQLPEKACEDFNKALNLGYKNAYLLIREYCSSSSF